jgi:hypothetical protein
MVSYVETSVQSVWRRQVEQNLDRARSGAAAPLLNGSTPIVEGAE